MNAEDYKILINKVWFRGFWVPGIANQRSDKKWRPKVEFINNDVVLNRKIRKGGKHNYELLIEAMIKTDTYWVFIQNNSNKKLTVHGVIIV